VVGKTSYAVLATMNIAAAIAPGAAPVIGTATPWPYTAIVSFTPPMPPAGKTVKSYTATAVGAVWIRGIGPSSPIMVQGGWPVGANHTFTVVANYSDSTSSGASSPSNAVVITGTTKFSTSPNVYANGKYFWAIDYSFGFTMQNYADTTGLPTMGTYDYAFTTMPGQGGGWSAVAPSDAFDITPYNFLNITIKPTIANESWGLQMVQVGDKLVGNKVAIKDATYGPVPQAGVWGTYKIPFSALGIGGTTGVTTMYKMAVEFGATPASRQWYVQDWHFSAN
jgi:hypothetical protein